RPMTEAEWLACIEPRTLLEFFGLKASTRKLRLFSCACCRRARHLVEDDRLHEAIETLERVADRAAKEKSRVQVSRLSLEIAQLSPNQRYSFVGWELHAASKRNLEHVMSNLGDAV